MGAEEVPIFWQWQGRFSYLVVSSLLGFAVISLLRLAIQSWKTQQRIRTCPQITLLGKRSRLVTNPLPFSALVGFWQPELIITQGLLTTLDNEHLEAVFSTRARSLPLSRYILVLLACLGAFLYGLATSYRGIVARATVITGIKSRLLGCSKSRFSTVGRIVIAGSKYGFSATR